MSFKRALTFFDVTNITVGAIVGADIYVAAAITAGLVGPASMLAWVAAGALATTLALTLAQCAALVPEVGGPYAYARKAFGPLAGFLAGWSMWIAELTALPVFAIAFTNYLGYFFDLGTIATHAIRIGFLAVLTTVNVISVRVAGRVNDALTLLKLAPLFALVAGGLVYMAFHTGDVGDNLSPFAPYGFDRFPEALLLVFWAYAGFELTTVPSGEVQDSERTIPRALATGMLIVTVFYLSTNLVLYSLVPHTELAASGTPLVLVGRIIFGPAGAALVAIGAMISVSGSDESDMLGSSRLGYAMAADGLLPHGLAAIHPTWRTPYVALMAQAAVAVALTFVDQIGDLISFAVVNLAFSFLVCAFALVRLQRDGERRIEFWRRALPFVAILICVGLLIATSTQDKIVGAVVLLGGALLYLAVAPRRPLPGALAHVTDGERVQEGLARRRMRFLGRLVAWVGGRRA